MRAQFYVFHQVYHERNTPESPRFPLSPHADDLRAGTKDQRAQPHQILSRFLRSFELLELLLDHHYYDGDSGIRGLFPQNVPRARDHISSQYIGGHYDIVADYHSQPVFGHEHYRDKGPYYSREAEAQKLSLEVGFGGSQADSNYGVSSSDQRPKLKLLFRKLKEAGPNGEARDEKTADNHRRGERELVDEQAL